MQSTSLATRNCQYCGQGFPKGSRADKMFCGDTCRNNYNKKKNIERKLPAHKNRTEILKIIKKNYEFLRAHSPISTDKGEYTCLELKDLKGLKDFNPRFYTSTKLIGTQHWYFCFDLGFMITESSIWFVNAPLEAAL